MHGGGADAVGAVGFDAARRRAAAVVRRASRMARAPVPLRSTAVMTRRPRMRRGPVMPPACWARARILVSPRTAAWRSRSGLLRGLRPSTSRSSIRSWRRRGLAMALRSRAWSKPGGRAAALYGRAVLPERIAATAGDYGIHPALLDAGLHLLATGPGSATRRLGAGRCCFRSRGRMWRCRQPVPPSCDVRMSCLAAPMAPKRAPTMSTCSTCSQQRVASGRRASSASGDAAEQVRKASQSAARGSLPHRLASRGPGHGAVPSSQWAVWGNRGLGAGAGVEAYATVSALCAALDVGAAVPERVIVDARRVGRRQRRGDTASGSACDG